MKFRYYGIAEFSDKGLTDFLHQTVDNCINELTQSHCIGVDEVSVGTNNLCANT